MQKNKTRHGSVMGAQLVGRPGRYRLLVGASDRAQAVRRRSHARERHAPGHRLHDLKLPMLLPGITLSTSPTDFDPIKQMQLEKFDGTTWRLFGEALSASGLIDTDRIG
jgi:hypothetical protein